MDKVNNPPANAVQCAPAATADSSKPRSYKGRSSAERIEERRLRLIDSAIAVYGSSGYRASTVKQVCLHAGLTERYFYESFAGSEQLLCVACSKIMQTLRDRAVSEVAQTQGSLTTKMRAAAESYFLLLKAKPESARLTLFEMEGVSPEVDEHLRTELEKSTTSIDELVFKQQPAKHSQPLDSHLLARGLLGALYQLAKEWTRSGFDLPVSTMVEHYVTLSIGTLAQYQQEND